MGEQTQGSLGGGCHRVGDTDCQTDPLIKWGICLAIVRASAQTMGTKFRQENHPLPDSGLSAEAQLTLSHWATQASKWALTTS